VMGRWARDRAPLIVGAVLVGGAIAGAGWAYHLSPAGRSGALSPAQFVVALGGVLVAAITLLVSVGRRPPARSVDALAALLAEAVEGQWRQAATERRLLTPDPIPMHWSLSDLAVTGSVAAAVGAPESPPAFPPLPQRARITAADLHAGGGRAELYRVYAGLASGRVVVVGAPGAGKSGTAILLLLDALDHRGRLDDSQRARVPVPVLLTAHGWDPNTRSVRDWLRDQLATTYPLFAHRGEAATLVAARDKVALILDGLDEMDEKLRPAALQALSDAPFRVVVLTRSREIVQAASRTWLAGAIAIHLHDVTASQAAEYLQRARTGPPPEGWTDLLTRLGEHPDGVLARGLSTPLTLTLLRDTYQAGDDVRELLDPTRYPTTDTIERDLIARVLPAAYTPRPGRPPPRYTEKQARQTLSFLARKMGKNRDLAWWCIPRWTAAAPRVLAYFVATVAAGEIAGELTGWLTGWLMDALLVGLICGLAGGLTQARAVKRGIGEPRRVGALNWHVIFESFPRLFGGGAGFALITSLISWLRVGLRIGLVIGLIAGVMIVLAAGFAIGLTDRGTGAGLPMDPRMAWRNDQISGLVEGLLGGLAFGPTIGLFVSLAFGLASGLKGGLTYGITAGLTFVLLTGYINPASRRTTLAWFQLQRARHVPAVSLMPFLEDARERDILRTVGAVYQFRHAMLQDQLAAVPRSSQTCVKRAAQRS
ncbi:MAG: hypothetical protein ACRDRS_19545, partial [Pseudonocardiaceae bacterium]